MFSVFLKRWQKNSSFGFFRLVFLCVSKKLNVLNGRKAIIFSLQQNLQSMFYFFRLVGNDLAMRSAEFYSTPTLVYY